MKVENFTAGSLLTESALCSWLGDALPGDVKVYHRGHLAFDCSPATSRFARREQTELIRVARRARFAQDSGLAFLIQRRHGPDDYSYLIVARTRRHPDRLTNRVADQAQGDVP